MEFKNFTASVKDAVEKRTGGGCKVCLSDVRRNNGVVLSALTVIEDDSNISPVIYLNGFYDDYRKGSATFETVVNDVMGLYEKNKAGMSFDPHKLLEYGNVKDRIIYKLINTEKNRELLSDIPHIPFHDLSIVFEYLMSGENIRSTILIHNAHMEVWGVDAEELYRAAGKNTPILQGYSIKPIINVISEMMENNPEMGMQDHFYECMPDENRNMYVLSNKSMTEGAACILYPDLIKDFAEAAGSDLIVIPSSIHESLLLTNVDESYTDEIKKTVREINEEHVSEEEVLSDSVYFYERLTGTLRRI